MLFQNSLHSSECLYLYVLGEKLMSFIHGTICVFQKALIIYCNVFIGSSSCTVNDSAGMIVGPGSVFLLSLLFTCNTSTLLGVLKNWCSV
jgi:hypothetical protein